MSIAQLLPLILLFPLIGAIVNGTIGKKLSEKTVGAIGTLMPALSFVTALLIFLQLDQPVKSVLFPIINLDSLHLDASLYADNLSIWMAMIVSGVGALIHLFSIGYMHNDKGFFRFFSYLNIFVFAMLTLVLSSNYFLLYFGWEGVSICSYLLIGFNYHDKKDGVFNSWCGRKSFVMNRIGDIGIFIGLFLLLATFGTLEYDQLGKMVLSGENLPSLTMITAIVLALFFGATSKSAQIPLFTWLPDAMAGPTPVSALIHAATMVTAGIFLMVRTNFLLHLSPIALDVILYVGLATSIIAAFIALRQNDIKKVLAYSTVSQLGLIFVAIGVEAYTTAIFHVTTHAFFKALLFLAAGSVIHSLSGEQDIRKMGGLKNKIGITHITFLAGTLAISGFPLFSGFYSKDEILAYAYSHSNIYVYIALVISIAMTAVYMFRLYYVVFFGKYRGSKETESHIHESPANMTIPLIVLGTLSVIGGVFNLPGTFLQGNGTHYLSKILSSNTIGLDQIHISHPEHSTALILIGIAVATCLIILFISDIVYRKKESVPLEYNQMTLWEKFSNKKMYWDEAYDFLFVKPLLYLSEWLHKWIESILLSGIIQGIISTVSVSSDTTRKWESGKVNSYIFWMVLGIVGFISFYLFKI